MALEQAKNDHVARPPNTPNATSSEPLSNTSIPISTSQLSHQPTPPSFFRLRDLPEELQRHIISFCLRPNWSICASRQLRSTNPSPSSQNPFFYGLRRVPPMPSLYLVDKHMAGQIRVCDVPNFTGVLSLSDVSEGWDIPTYYQYGLREVPEPRVGLLDGYRGLITTMHMENYKYVKDIHSFDMSLIDLLPNLRVVIQCTRVRIRDEFFYCWSNDKNPNSESNEEQLDRWISDEALIREVQEAESGWSESVREPESEQFLGHLWKKGLTTLCEKRVKMGTSESAVWFRSVFWVRESRDTIVMGKFPEHKWLESRELRRSVYKRAVDVNADG